MFNKKIHLIHAHSPFLNGFAALKICRQKHIPLGNAYYEMPNDGFFIGDEEPEETKGDEEKYDVGSLLRGNAVIILALGAVIGYFYTKKK